jgi:exopolyphosphatase / guanosine-5'-triphosphate,3'-diphosphate pyrophosphatase
VPAELLDGAEEGRLSYRGATAELPPSAGDDVVLDIGGGSTELVLRGDAGVEAVSLDLGCVRLTERHLHHDPPTADELAGARMTIAAELERAVTVVPRLGRLRPPSRLIGLAGTVSTVAALDQGLAHYDRDRIHHFTLSRSMVDGWCRRLAELTAAERAALPGMVEGRQDVIVGGVAVLDQVMDRFGFATCLVSESDILDGLVASLLEDGHAGGTRGTSPP